MNKTIIFDFDGTLADTMEYGIGIYNSLAPRYNLRQLAPSEIPWIRNMSAREVIKESGIRFWQLPFLLAKLKKSLRRDIQQITPFTDIDQALRTLQKDGHRLGIMTSNNKDSVQQFLKQHGLSDMFDFVHSEKNLFKKHTALRRLIHTYKLSPLSTVYIGDEIRDINAAKQVGIPIGSVTWGFNTKEALAKMQPNFMIEQPADLPQQLSH